MENLREALKYFNMKEVSEKADISYQILRNFNNGRKKHLTDREYNAVIQAIQTILEEL